MNTLLRKKTRVHFFALILLISYSYSGAWAQENAVKKMTVKAFSILHIEGPFAVELIQASEPSLLITGTEDLQKRISIDNNEGHLYIKWMQAQGDPSEKIPVKVYITSLTDLTLNTSGTTTVTAPLQFETINLTVFSRGNSLLAITAKMINMTAQGSGDITLAGNTPALSLYHYGAGNIDASQLKAENAALMTTSKGEVSVFASDHLGITATGSGNITYSGTPKKVQISNSGKGSVQKAKS
jgi:hypothetical protein